VISPFDRPEIDASILSYARSFLNLPSWEIAERWHGVYATSSAGMPFVAEPAPGVVIVTGLGGAGMTISFGLAEEVVENGLRSMDDEFKREK
jgi:glycine/D-amino acid oxidase-like deaminating enzyme